ncbi:ATP-binding cassette domain-containing protein [Marinilabiliaceae bacterium ANBcel2]|nr:ATP-binding cassette domain-containing protein [Marinilabiliaceae bacterium ANBcel2]
MKEKALKSIVSLFALVVVFKPGKGLTLIRNILEVYLSTYFSKQTTDEYSELFVKKVKDYLSQVSDDKFMSNHHFLEELEVHCYILSREISLLQRFRVLIFLMEYLPYMTGKTSFYIADESYELVYNIAMALHINESDFHDAFSFGSEAYHQIGDRNSLYIITDNPAIKIEGVKIDVVDNLKGQLIFLKLTSLNTILVRVNGDVEFEANHRRLFQRSTYILENGSVITAGDSIFYYNDIYKSLSEGAVSEKLLLKVDNVEYAFNNGNKGVHKTTFACRSGEMLAIMGGSGSGKTTLMNLLIGAYKPQNGTVSLNNCDVYKDASKVRGYIGYVPQDDALNEDLTAFENLYFSAGLSRKHLSKDERINLVDTVLEELGLSKIRDLKVGNSLDKVISGGQRKRLNIAIELIRDPGIIFLDEPTSGLSSADSELIMQLLKNATYKGKMVIVNIHQPSGDVFKLFDTLLFIDNGGYPVYFGPAMQVISYLKNVLQLADAHESQCQSCGNVNPDEIFHLVERTHIDSSETPISSRRFTPEKWHKRFLNYINRDTLFDKDEKKLSLISQKLEIPSVFKQFHLYFLRNLFTKVADAPYLSLSFLLPALLGLLLSLFSRYIVPGSQEYSYFYNDNMPVYVFMSVIVAMFVGIMSGSTEIIKDRITLKREAFLDLSYSSFVFSKLIYLIVLSGIQMGSFVLISKLVLEIPVGVPFYFYLMWSTAVASGVIGMVISSIFKTMASVYVSIPFLLIPQILFSGAVIDFNKVHPSFASDRYAPLISEFMLSKWMFEAISVNFFLESDYNKKFYDIDKNLNKAAYYRNFFIPELQSAFFGDSWSSDKILTPDSANYKLVKNGIKELDNILDSDLSNIFEDDVIEGTEFVNVINIARQECVDNVNRYSNKKDSIIIEMGDSKYSELRATQNRKIEQVVLDESNINNVIISHNHFIRKMAPAHFVSDNYWGRSHLYAAERNFFNTTVSTFKYNIVIVWGMTLFFLVIVILNRPKD